MKTNSKIYIFLILLTLNSIYAEKVVTTQEDLPDAYFGLKVGAVITPTFGYRLRNSSSGISNAATNDRTGFSMPWTLFMISKEWEEKKITVEFWGEVIRSSAITNDTEAGTGNKANPYILSIRRASLRKDLELGIFNFSFLFGIHELPHVYTQWKGYWNWRYVDKAPMESLGFSTQPADLGGSILMKVKDFSLHAGLVNGEGYRNIQNTNSSGYDFVSRISYEPEFANKIKTGFHLLGKAGNVIGVAGDECKEGKSSCLASDRNTLTRKEMDLRAQHNESLGGEFTFLFDRYINFGSGVVWKKQYRGKIIDKLNQNILPTYEPDLKDRAFYSWIGFGISDFELVLRGETGTGANGVLTPQVRGDKSRFTRKSVFINYTYSDSVRFALGFSDLVNFDRDGVIKRDYIDYQGDISNKNAYEAQYLTGVNRGIVSYTDRDRQLFIKSTIDF